MSLTLGKVRYTVVVNLCECVCVCACARARAISDVQISYLSRDKIGIVYIFHLSLLPLAPSAPPPPLYHSFLGFAQEEGQCSRGP